jgi:hypothetical protein
LAEAAPLPSSDGNQTSNIESYPIIINEYGWLWLNRDGSPTTLTNDLYKNLLGANSTVSQRRKLYASYMAAETEFWRCNRKAAGVLIFTALGYSRKDGQTSDFFIDPVKLEYESEFLKYLPDAFSPAGLMLEEWGNEIETGKDHNFNIKTINDLEKEWSGTVYLQILKDNKTVASSSIKLIIPGYGQKEVTFSCRTPKIPGVYTVIASLQKKGEKTVKSIREIPFK